MSIPLKYMSWLLRLVLPLLLASAITLALFATIRWSAFESDTIVQRRQEQLVELIVSQIRANVAHDQESATVWDDAVTAVTTGEDVEWIDTNLGKWMNTYFQHDGAFVVSPDRQLRYAFLSNEPDAKTAYARIEAGAVPLIAELQARLAAEDTSGVTDQVLSIGQSDLVSVDNRPAIISVKPIISDTGDIEQVPGQEFLHIAVRYLDGNFLETVAREYVFEDLRFTWTMSSDDGRSYAPLTTEAGRVFGYFSWSPFKPGAGVVAATSPVLGAAAIILFIVLSILGTAISARSARLRDSQTRLAHLAHHDPLTGLPNRGYFNRRLDEMLAASKRTQTNAVLYLDLDRFKQVNDTLGHPVGDQLIVAVATRLKEIADKHTVARLGGDEFTIIVEDTSRERIEELCDRLIVAIRQPFEIGGQPILIGLSIGVAIGTQDDRTGSDLTRKSDIALYHAKTAGRNRYAIFGTHMDELVQSRRELEQDLRHALADGQMEVHYQPVYTAAGHRMTGIEALLRWHHPVKGAIPPDVFIPLAEESGLIERLGEFVLAEACKAALEWGHLEVAVNASAIELRNEAYALRVLSALNRIGFDPRRLEIEITESAFTDESGHCERNITALRSAGIRFALDDFGTGFSSFGRLQRLDVDRIKIDRCFVSGFGQESGNEAIVEAMIGLAQAKNLKTTAEGIETAEQGELLRQLGCDQLQGYHLSRPVSGQVLSRMLADAKEDSSEASG